MVLDYCLHHYDVHGGEHTYAIFERTGDGTKRGRQREKRRCILNKEESRRLENALAAATSRANCAEWPAKRQQILQEFHGQPVVAAA